MVSVTGRLLAKIVRRDKRIGEKNAHIHFDGLVIAGVDDR